MTTNIQKDISGPNEINYIVTWQNITQMTSRFVFSTLTQLKCNTCGWEDISNCQLFSHVHFSVEMPNRFLIRLNFSQAVPWILRVLDESFYSLILKKLVYIQVFCHKHATMVGGRFFLLVYICLGCVWDFKQ